MLEALYAGMNKCLLTTPIAFVNNGRRSKAKLCKAQNYSLAKGTLANKPKKDKFNNE